MSASSSVPSDMLSSLFTIEGRNVTKKDTKPAIAHSASPLKTDTIARTNMNALMNLSHFTFRKVYVL